jgi:ABC-type transporter Mla subunit MlaD
MRLEKDDAKIGLLVALALALFVGFLFSRGVSPLLRRTTHVRVGLDSVADLAEGTEVQLQGLRVGQVEAMTLRRSGVLYRFQVTLGLRPDIVLWTGTRAVVVSKPLGSTFVDLQLPPPAQRLQPLAADGELEGGSSPSLGALVEHLDALVMNLDHTLDQARAPFQARGLGVLLEHPRVRTVLTELDGSLRAVQALAGDSRGLVQRGGSSLAALDQALASLDRSLLAVGKLAERGSGDLDTVTDRLDGTLAAVADLAQALRDQAQTLGPDAGASLQSLDRTLRAAEDLLELLKARPSRIVWGRPSARERETAAASAEAARARTAAGRTAPAAPADDPGQAVRPHADPEGPVPAP